MQETQSQTVKSVCGNALDGRAGGQLAPQPHQVKEYPAAGASESLRANDVRLLLSRLMGPLSKERLCPPPRGYKTARACLQSARRGWSCPSLLLLGGWGWGASSCPRPGFGRCHVTPATTGLAASIDAHSTDMREREGEREAVVQRLS